MDPKVLIICGGPSCERSLSINSARNVVDLLGLINIKPSVLLVEVKKNLNVNLNITQINKQNFTDFLNLIPVDSKLLYSNTNEDFLHLLPKALDISLQHFLRNFDLVFNVVHGTFGEDGTLQSIMNEAGVKYVGSKINVENMFFKHKFYEFLQNQGHRVLPYKIINRPLQQKQELTDFLNTYGQIIIKPVDGGSSIDVFYVNNLQTLKKALRVCNNKLVIYKKFLAEPYQDFLEFSVVIRDGEVFLPTLINKLQDKILNFSGKYFCSKQIEHVFLEEEIALLNLNNNTTLAENYKKFLANFIKSCKSLYQNLQAQDVLRLDGWIFEKNLQQINQHSQFTFSDCNVVPGLEQNSLVFQQALRSGYNMLDFIVYFFNKYLPNFKPNINTPSRELFIICGGNSSEQEVSLLSGVNVFWHLSNNRDYRVKLFLMQNNYFFNLPLNLMLMHNVRDINKYINNYKHLQNFNMEAFLTYCKTHNIRVFNALHGDRGEDGTLQKMFNKHNIMYTGIKCPQQAQLFMDKFATAAYVTQLNLKNIGALSKHRLDLNNLQIYSLNYCQNLINDLKIKFNCSSLIIKPNADGCSTGIIILLEGKDLFKFVNLVKNQTPLVEAHSFFNQSEPIIMPLPNSVQFFSANYIIEPFIETNRVLVKNNNYSFEKNITEFPQVELTVGFVNLQKFKNLNVLPPSLSVVNKGILNAFEKFQGGTGINLTPIPQNLINITKQNNLYNNLYQLYRAIKPTDYLRVDFFYNMLTEEITLIEINSLPALTPATVFFHQLRASHTPITPRDFFINLVNQIPKPNLVEHVAINLC